MHTQTTYDVAIAGGGLAGLALSIQLAEQGWQVALFEKEVYPFHRVCGEYISLESWDFLCRLSVPLPQWNLPIIKRLQVSAPNGTLLEANLPLGGFGVSRYKLDAALAKIAIAKGVHLFEATKVEDIEQQQNGFNIRYGNKHTTNTIDAKVCCGTWGKRSNMDIKWNRAFISDKDTRISNWVGIKYHVRTAWPADLIALHNFKDGYCGISKIEDDQYCLCYLTRAANLKSFGHSVAQMEAAILSRNPVLQRLLNKSEKEAGFPLAISQVSFQPKEQVENGVLLIGDASGMIAPLCGNGMSMALHGSKIAAAETDKFLKGLQNRRQMEEHYVNIWKKQFSRRLQAGRILHRFFGSEQRSNLLISTMRRLPFLTKAVIRQTHGTPF